MAETIRLTPAGLQTEAGIARCAAAQKTFYDRMAEVANLASQFVDAFDASGAGLDDEDGGSELNALRFAVERHAAAQEELLRSIGGAPRQPGVCQVCGCTDDQACEPPCAWADEEHTICTSPECLAKRDALRKAAA